MMTKTLRWAFIALLIAVSQTVLAQSLDYSDESLWWANGGERASEVDVFYVLPTCVGAWADDSGVMHYNADAYSAKHRRAWELSCVLAKQIFGDGTNFYLPYYRQRTFGKPTDEQQSIAASMMAREDALNAFKYYLEHYNQGRRFILAGFSQGACLLVQIIKEMDSDTYKRMIAAYAVGGSVTADDLRHPNVKAARKATDIGVIVCFNSWAKMDGEKPKNVLFEDNVVCINPVTWTTKTRSAVLWHGDVEPRQHDKNFPYGTAIVPAEKGKDVTVAIDNDNHMLMVDGINPEIYMLPSMADMFPKGSLHLQELFFYGDLLKANAALRSRQK